jgi:hypothetical protein
LFHYTTGRNLAAILRAGVIRPSENRERKLGEKAAVWFTYSPDWDHGASMDTDAIEGIDEIRATADGIALAQGRAASDAYLHAVALELCDSHTGGFVGRIGVTPDVAPYTWDDYVRIARWPAAAVRELEARDRQISNPDEWRVSFVPVPCSKWISVETRSRTRWGAGWQPLAIHAGGAQ